MADRMTCQACGAASPRMHWRNLRDETHTLAIGLAAIGPAELAAKLGISKPMSRQPNGVLVRCPVHGDTTPSLSITKGPDRLIRARCFGCDLSGDAFTLIAAVTGLDIRSSFGAIVEHARAITGDVAPHFAERPKPQPAIESAPSLDDESFDKLGRWLLEKCPLADDADGVAYMRSRGLLDVSVGRLGCLPEPRFQGALVSALCSELGEHIWRRSGLTSGDAMAARFTWSDRRLLIPWRSTGVDGLITNVQRRAMSSNHGKGPKYVAATGRLFSAPFGIEDALELADDETPLVVVEGALDTLAARKTFAANGYHAAVVGIPGVQGWRSSWARFGKGLDVKIGLDGDDAGEAAVAKLAQDFFAEGAHSVSRLKPIGKDWAEQVES